MATTFGKRGAVLGADVAPAPRRAADAHSEGPSYKVVAAIAIAAGTVAALFAGGSSGLRQPVPQAVEAVTEQAELPVPSSRIRVSATATPTYPVVTPMTLCKDRYKQDYQMRETCVRMQEEAKLEVQSMQIDDDVKVLCAGRYIHDWSMYATCARMQMAAKLPVSEKADRPRFDISQKCETQWPNDRSMQNHCSGQQEQARARASGGWIDHTVAVTCTGRWPHDWTMFMHCVDREMGSRRR